MTVLDQLARAKGRRDEAPNIELARAIVKRGDRKAIAELVAAIESGTAATQGDAIKVLYEVGALAPKLIVKHLDRFFAALSRRNNRLVWGALAAIDAIASSTPDRVAARLPELVAAWPGTSVIGRDKIVATLGKLAANGTRPAVPALIECVADSAVNQLPTYAETAAMVVTGDDVVRLRDTVTTRLRDVELPAKRKRLERVLARLDAASNSTSSKPASPSKVSPTKASPAGYSGTALVKKLGIKDGRRVAFVDAPDPLPTELAAFAQDTSVATLLRGGPFDVILLFVKTRRKLESRFASAMRALDPFGGLWICWPKRASGVVTDVTEDVVREVALAAGLVDNKVCAVDPTWSGLRCVVRVADRPKKPLRQR